ncbi:MAG: NYN domain-containing protein [Bacteroidia bacterium]|nr:NYN domain-containing protein [Bacteroidia bacterium]
MSSSNNPDNKLIRVGVFYDGNFFYHISNYYNYEHERKARLSIAGLHDFICHKVADFEKTDRKFCQVVDAHYFRGRLNAFDAQESNRLLSERIFDDILMQENVVTHYLPLKVRDGRIEEKGVDVWLALEAYEMALYKKYNVLVLIASDSDYTPLVRKLSTFGTRVMVLGWDFSFVDERTGRERRTVTSIDLLREATYPMAMADIIDNNANQSDQVVNSLFINRERKPRAAYSPADEDYYEEEGYDDSIQYEEGEVLKSEILSLKNGYGFISMPPNNLYFHWTFLQEDDFNDLYEGDAVEFTIGKNDKGQDIALNVRKIHE